MSKSFFFVETGKCFGIRADAVWLAYSPLNGTAFLVDREEKAALEKECDNLSDSPAEKSPGAQALLRPPTRPIMRIPKTWNDVYEIDILLNFKCNFHCVYCYSAAGRSDTTLTWGKAKSLLDFLFSDRHAAKHPYRINFSGGGEPTISFDMVRRITDYIEKRSAISGHKFELAMVTNGSLLNPDIMDYIAAHKIRLVLSFEILERFQNAERGQYAAVASNLDELLRRNADFGVRATLTRNSAPAMPEMIEEIHTRFPRLTSVVFDTVLAPALFPAPDDLSDYYEKFFDYLVKAQALGDKYGINVGGPFSQLLGFQRERTCLGKIVLTPEGFFSMCSRVSSHKEKLFDDFIYGKIDTDSNLVIDDYKFNRLMNENTIEANPECKNCFARWNCGGGCRLFSLTFPPAFFPVFCEFQRKGLIHEILAKLEKQFFKETGHSLREHIRKLSIS
ncbi:MAG: radical SAM protein [Lentisphaeria bacterium]|nr:radical SAM protein [Lentisphaeria bacterium]